MNINTKKYIETYIKIKDKNSNIIPLTLNMPQLRLYNIIKQQKELNKPIRIIILKARQMGFSTLTEAIIFENTVTKFHINSGIITHVDTATNNLFNMSKLMYNELPVAMQPAIKNSNAKELIFDTPNGTGLGSKIKCMTAGSAGVGRSDTFNYLHISELAFWKGDKKTTLTGLLQAVPNTSNSMIIIESTANGYEYYRELWYMAINGESDYIPLFVGWNELEEYKMKYTGFDLTQEEKELQQLYNLTLEQLTWRRWCIKNNCGGDIEQFKQEYPINSQEAFISTGLCVFDKQAIINRIQQLKEPIKIGSFLYDYDGLKIKNIKWQDDVNGFIKLYELPKKGYPYVLGGDTAGEGSDNFTGHVIDNTSGKQVATLKRQFDEDEYARQMYCLGEYYNNALVGIETNFSTFPQKEMERLDYKNFYVREKEDTYTNKTEKAFGFKTTKVTRPLIIADLVQIVRDNADLFNDKATLEEMLTFVRNENGRPEAQNGAHDDLVMGIAITYYIRSQQSFKIEIQQEDINKVFNFRCEKESSDIDVGSEIVVI